MRFKVRPNQIPQPKGKAILAKGPQDCKPLTPQEFSSAVLYVTRAFLSAVHLPKEFFTGVPLSGVLDQEGAKRTLLAAYAHFKQDSNRALSFFFRYKALLDLGAVADLSNWVVRAEGTDYSTYTTDILDLAARHPLLPSGQFDPSSFLTQLQLESVDQDAPESVPPQVSHVELEPERIAA